MVEMRAIVIAEPREQRQIVSARQYVYGIDLQEPQAVDCASDMAGVRGVVGAPGGKTLCGESDAARGGCGEFMALHAPILATRAGRPHLSIVTVILAPPER